LPLIYDPSATCPEWDKFIASVVPDDCTELIYELIAWLMTRDRSIQKLVILLGVGANGKSTLIKGITAFLGRDTVSAIDLYTLESNRFAVVNLLGKLANIWADLPNKTLETTSVMKAITGGDRIMAERKFGKQFEYEPFAKLLFSSNGLPKTTDFSERYFGRLLPIPFPNEFPEIPKVGRTLDARLSDPKELSGVLNRALALLPRLRSNGFAQAASVQECLDEYRTSSDPVSEWLAEEVDVDPDEMISKQDLYQAYRKDMKRDNKTIVSQKQFGSSVKRILSVVEGQRTVAGNSKTWVYMGIRFRAGSQHGINAAKG
jgi:putative DNA primase/helicase